jgi:hypothetical protein
VFPPAPPVAPSIGLAAAYEKYSLRTGVLAPEARGVLGPDAYGLLLEKTKADEVAEKGADR